MTRRAGLLSICAVLLWACGGADPAASGDDDVTLPPGSSAGTSPPKSLSPADVTVAGILGFDDIEGGCAFVQAADGTRYEVIYPDGWTIDRTRAELRGPDGQVTTAGDPVTVRGAVATDRSSICQIGPIFEATEVEIPSS